MLWYWLIATNFILLILISLHVSLFACVVYCYYFDNFDLIYIDFGAVDLLYSVTLNFACDSDKFNLIVALRLLLSSVAVVLLTKDTFWYVGSLFTDIYCYRYFVPLDLDLCALRKDVLISLFALHYDYLLALCGSCVRATKLWLMLALMMVNVIFDDEIRLLQVGVGSSFIGVACMRVGTEVLRCGVLLEFCFIRVGFMQCVVVGVADRLW
eukprot:gene3490-2441_t